MIELKFLIFFFLANNAKGHTKCGMIFKLRF